MKTITPAGSSLSLQDVLAAPEGATVSFHGMAHAVRDLGDVCFVLLRATKLNPVFVMVLAGVLNLGVNAILR